MSVQRTPMTRPGFERLRDELDRLKRVDRHAITKAIAEARAHGDLSENAEYHAAREKQSFIEGRIAELEGKVGNAEVIDPPTSGERVTFASTVLLEDDFDGLQADGDSMSITALQSSTTTPACVSRTRRTISSPTRCALAKNRRPSVRTISSPGQVSSSGCSSDSGRNTWVPRLRPSA